MSETDDVLEIARLSQRYALAVDSKDWNRLKSCFTDDVVVIDYKGDTTAGVDSVIATFVPMLDPFPRTQHVCGLPDVTIDGDAAEGSVHAIGTHVANGPDGDRVVNVGVWYRDQYRRTAAGWRISRRWINPVWMAGDPSILT